MDKMTLYSLSAEYERAFDSLEVNEETGEVTGFDLIDALDSRIDVKLENTAQYLKNLVALVESMEAEEKRLKERKRVLKNKTEGLKKYINECMQLCNRSSFETAKTRIGFRKSTVVEIEDASEIPAIYMKVNVEVEPDKKKIKETLKMGGEVPGAHLEERMNITIK